MTTRPITRRRRVANNPMAERMADVLTTRLTGFARVCAWCGLWHRDGQWSTGAVPAGVPISHGICPDCEARYCEALEEQPR